jgi:soluble lytic murein transglycosylase
VVSCLALACTEQKVAAPPPPRSAAELASAPVAPAQAPDDAGAPAVSAAPAWLEAVRLERWTEAASQLDALPEAELARPALRFVRAKAAARLGDGERALALLDELEGELPALRPDIDDLRATAWLAAGKLREAAAYYGRSADPADRVRAADALDRAGDAAQAASVVEAAVTLAQKRKDDDAEVAARALRARLDRAAGRKHRAALDLRWLALHAPGSAEGRGALSALATLQVKLSPKEKLDAATELAADGRGQEALALLEGLGAGVPRGALLHARATALFKVRDDRAAASAFLELARLHTKHEAEALYYAGRALERDGRADDALARYREVTRRLRASPWAERAAYNEARLLLQTARYAEASARYAAYLARYSKAKAAGDVEYEAALARLAAGDAAGARDALGRLAKAATREQAGRLRQLEALAARRAGDTDGAVAIWTEVATTLPLTWPALAARARLVEAGAPVPASLAVPPAAPAVELALPEPVALLASVGLDADAERHLAAQERALATALPGRESESLCGLYGSIGRAKRRYRIGSAAVDFPLLMRAPGPSEAWAWDCVYPRPFAGEVARLEAQNELPPGLLHAVMRQESAFDPDAVSPVGAIGLMQLMPTTAERLAAEAGAPFDPRALTAPEQNLTLGARYLGKLLRMLGGNVALAAAAYNAGPKAVSRWLGPEPAGDLDLWVARIPYGETRNYVARVVGNLARYRWLRGDGLEVPLGLPPDARVPDDAY